MTDQHGKDFVEVLVGFGGNGMHCASFRVQSCAWLVAESLSPTTFDISYSSILGCIDARAVNE